MKPELKTILWPVCIVEHPALALCSVNARGKEGDCCTMVEAAMYSKCVSIRAMEALKEGRECEINMEHAASKLQPLRHEARWLRRESCACAQLPLPLLP